MFLISGGKKDYNFSSQSKYPGSKKIDGVGPVDNRPRPTSSTTLSK